MSSANKRADLKSTNPRQSAKAQVNIPKQTPRQASSTAAIASPTTNSKIKQTTFTRSNGNATSQQLTPLPIINTPPTSLTNLAQLSGITLLPMTNPRQRAIASNLPASISMHRAPNFIKAPTTNPLNRNKVSNGSSRAANTVVQSQQTIYNLANIPSIQSLNQTSTSTSSPESMHWRTSTNEHKNQATAQLQSKSSLNRVNINRTKAHSNLNLQHSDVKVIPITQGLPVFTDVADIPTTQSGHSFDDMVSQASLESGADEQCVNVNGDQNNISLIKLMAILNNPALTITAVASKDINKPSPVISNDTQQKSAMSFLDGPQLSITIPNSSNKAYQRKNDYFQSMSGKEQLQTDLTLKSRIPKSAANLQVMQSGSSTNCLSPTFKLNSLSVTNSRNTDSINPSQELTNLQSSNQKQPDLNWLSNYDSSGSRNGQFPNVSWSNGFQNQISSLESSSFKLNDPSMLSTSVRNLMMQQQPSGTKQPTVSVQLLKHIANQTKDNSWTNNQLKSVLEPECILSVPRKVQQLNQGAKRMESLKTVTSSIQKKIPKEPLRTSKERLFIPRIEDTTRHGQQKVFEPHFNMNSICISGVEEREVHVSEQHLVLDSMMSNDTEAKQKSAVPEPDEIFINRSKRVMSKIDTMIERKKRRRFERISGRAAPKTNSLEDQCAESEDEWSSDENTDLQRASIIKTQLPLDEVETDEKKNHFLSLGLVSRKERNRLSIAQSEEKLKIFSPLAFEEHNGTPEDLQRFVHTILKTGGSEVYLRVDSNIKRNDLPLVEGLNRNTSKLKMSYMNMLGLEKRSKRTTLYKVRPMDNTNFQQAPKPIDLNKVKSVTSEKQKVEIEVSKQLTSDRSIGNNAILAAKLAFTNCREAVKPPNKNEYMKSLGLMAS